MTKKKSKGTKEFEEQFEEPEPEPETHESPKAAQETRRQEFKGPFSSKIEELCNNLLTVKQERAYGFKNFMTATKSRIRELGEDIHAILKTSERNRAKAFKNFITATKGRIRELSEETHDFLQISERDRIKKFNVFASGCKARVKELNLETHNTLNRFRTENKERAEDMQAAHGIWQNFSRKMSMVR